jgi:hypothetical protein
MPFLFLSVQMKDSNIKDETDDTHASKDTEAKDEAEGTPGYASHKENSHKTDQGFNGMLFFCFVFLPYLIY